MRYLGIDYGTGKVGIALSDEAGTMGFPHDTYENDARLTERVRTLAAEKEVETIVIGKSMDLSGTENPVAAAAEAFGTQLATETGLTVVYENEVFSTQEARRGLDGAHPFHVSDVARPRTVKGSGASKGGVDAAAAALILTSYLSRTHD